MNVSSKQFTANGPTGGERIGKIATDGEGYGIERVVFSLLVIDEDGENECLLS